MQINIGALLKWASFGWSIFDLDNKDNSGIKHGGNVYYRLLSPVIILSFCVWLLHILKRILRIWTSK